ncbi:MAG: hypothetical protein GY801_46505 [bacterium]|nr:hypothetical protein [bacterium]
MVLRDNQYGSPTVVKADYQARKITIAVSEARRREYFAIVRKTFCDIHATFEHLDFKELIPLPDDLNITLDFQELLGLEDMGEQTVPIGRLHRRYSLQELLDGISTQQSRSKEAQELYNGNTYYPEEGKSINSSAKERATFSSDLTGRVRLPIALRRRIVEFLTSLPAIDDNMQKSLIYRASLDPELLHQIQLNIPPEQFAQQLVSILGSYGMLEDGRDALEAVIEAAKYYAGKNRQASCDKLIGELHDKSSVQSRLT